MKTILALLLSCMSLVTTAQTFGRSGAFMAASVPKAAGGGVTDWTTVFTNQPGYPAYAFWYGPDYDSSGGTCADRTGNGFTISATGTAKPGTATLDSKQIISFDGVNDYLESQTFACGSNAEYIIAFKYTGYQVGVLKCLFYGYNFTPSHRAYWADTGAFQWGNGNGMTTMDQPNTLPTNTWQIVSVLFTNTGGNIYTNYNQANKITSVIPSTTTDGIVLASYYQHLAGWSAIDVAMCVVYPTNLTTTVRSNVFNAITNLWPSITLP